MKTVSIIYPSPFWLRPQSIATRAVCCLAARDLSPSSWDWSFPHARILDPRLVQSSYFRLIYFSLQPSFNRRCGHVYECLADLVYGISSLV